MADTYQRNVGDQISYGYRQLPGTGAAGGPDLKTVIVVGVGVFMGILVGTTIADGSWRSLNPLAPHHSVQVSSNNPANNPGTANHPIAKPAPTPSTPIQSVKPEVKQTPVNQALTIKQASISPAVSTLRKVSVVQIAPGTRKHSLLHRAVARRRHLGRRRAHSRHRLHVPETTLAIAKMPSASQALKPAIVAAPLALLIPSAFTVQGEVTVASYDPAAGTIDTYEGEAFSLDKAGTATGTTSWNDNASNIHYRCDQFWKCTLTQDGKSLLNATRTK